MTFGAREELEQRLSLIPPADMARGFVFTSTLDTVRAEAEAAAGRRCIVAAGGSFFVPVFKYPMRSLLRLLCNRQRNVSVRLATLRARSGTRDNYSGNFSGNVSPMKASRACRAYSLRRAMLAASSKSIVFTTSRN